MRQVIAILTGVFCVHFLADAETVSLSGTVKKGGTGIEGVQVSLKKFPNLSATTNASGVFTIAGYTSILRPKQQAGPFQFILRNGTIVFSPTKANLNGALEIFSSDGKRKTSINLSDRKPGNRSIMLPELASGLNFLRVTLGGESYTRSLVSMGNDLMLKNENSNTGKATNFMLTKRIATAAVDTLIAAKDGYATNKTALASYSQQNITITLDTAGSVNPGVCTRENLKAMVDKYIEAQTAGDPTKMPLATNVKVIQNNKEVTMENSICTKALKIDFNLSIFDVDSCRTYTEIIVANSTPAYVMGTSLKVKEGIITEIDALVTTQNDGWLFDAANYLKYAQQQNWYVLSAAERSTREKLIDAGNQYLDIFKADDEGIPWGAPCYRIEGGTCTLKGDTTKDYCKITSKEVLAAAGGKGFTISNRDFIVDVDLGAVNVYCAFCTWDAHMFRLVNGKFRYVHTLTVGCKM